MTTQTSEITVDSIRALVDGFYGRVQADPELGPIFDRQVGQSGGGWKPHLQKLTQFWSAILLGKPGYMGNPRVAHAGVPDIEGRHFARWLFLFQLEAHRVFTPEPAAMIVERARIIGGRLKQAIGC